MYNGKKSAFVRVVNGKLEEGEKITLSTGQEIASLKENEYYKYLGIYENKVIEVGETWKINVVKYLQRVWVIWNSSASGYNKIRSMNTFANPKLQYIMWVVDLKLEEIRKADMDVRKIMREKGAMAPGSCNALLYLQRGEGGRGLKSIEDLYEQAKIKIAVELMNNEDEDIRKVLKLEKGRRVYTIMEEAQERVKKLGLELKENEQGKWGVRMKGSRNPLESKIGKIGKIIIERQQAKYLAELDEKEMAGMYYWDFRKVEGWSYDSFLWLNKWKGIPTTTERKMFEMLEQLTNTKYRRKEIYGEKLSEDKCRLCKRKRETVRHLLSSCDCLAKNSYITRHNSALKVLYWWILHKYGLEYQIRKWNDRKEPESTRKNENVEVHWNVRVLSDEKTDHNKPDMLVINHKKRKIRVIEMSCPWDKNIKKKYEEKDEKYQTIRQELRKRYEGYELKQANIIVGALGTITTLRKELEKISKRAVNLVLEIQKVVITHSISIMENAFKREYEGVREEGGYERATSNNSLIQKKTCK